LRGAEAAVETAGADRGHDAEQGAGCAVPSM
jgi:hypothetical protein